MRHLVAAFGLVWLGVCSVADAQTFTQLYNFQGGSDGGNSFSGVTLDTAGNLYGTTLLRGNFSNCAYPGCGVVYKIDSSGNETPLYTFAGAPADGANPVAGVVGDADGNLFGTTKYGGANGYGTVYEVMPSGAEKVLQSFTGGEDGGIPNGGVILDQGGNLYGTTFSGGSAGLGTVFKLSRTGSLTTLYSFPDTAHGAHPNAALLLDSSGNLYGTTQYGGTANRGTVFKLDNSGTETVLYSFTGTPDGAYPQSQLVFDSAGNLYGTTTEGGSSNFGTAFKLTQSGAETVIHSFGGQPDGAYPMAGVAIDKAGNLYGTTFHGGQNGYAGTVYKIDPAGNETLLYGFQGSFDGQSPAGGLVLNPSATSVYGTAESAGFGCCGVVYQVSLP